MQGDGRAAFSYKMSSFLGIRFQAYKQGSYSEDRNQNSGQNLFIPTKREVQSQTFFFWTKASHFVGRNFYLHLPDLPIAIMWFANPLTSWGEFQGWYIYIYIYDIHITHIYTFAYVDTKIHRYKDTKIHTYIHTYIHT